MVRRAAGLDVVGITGSSGKTSTKDLLGAVLATAGETVAPVGSYNSEVGVPLTVCRVGPGTRFLVVEMGARGVGHIEYLTRMAPPRVGVVLNVGTAHVGEFGSRAAIARAKSELVAALHPSGRRGPQRRRPRGARDERPAPRRGSCSSASPRTPTSRATGVELDDHGRPSFTVHTPAGERSVRLGLVGRHHVANALAVVATALELGLDLDAVVAALEAATPVSRWRMEVTERPDGVTVVNDAYNANPDSMRAALTALQRMGRGGRRTWAVLGTMLELGDESEALHAEVGEEVVARGVDELLVVGEAARPLAAAPVSAVAVHGAAHPRPHRPRRRGRRGAAARRAGAGGRRPVQVQPRRRTTVARRPTGRTPGGTHVKAVLIAAVVSLVLALLGTPLFIKFLVKRGYGQFIRDDGPTSHHTKRGTPTMGGAVIVLASLVAYAVAHLVTLQAPTVSGLLVLFLMAGLGFVGFLDDYIKISKQRSLGLRSKQKLAGQTLVAVVFAVLALQFPNDSFRTPASTFVSFVRDTP